MALFYLENIIERRIISTPGLQFAQNVASIKVLSEIAGSSQPSRLLYNISRISRFFTFESSDQDFSSCGLCSVPMLRGQKSRFKVDNDGA